MKPRVLLVKTSSLGDIIHSFPALTDARQAVPGIQFDWVVETGFSEMPVWHPSVRTVFPIGIRAWRKSGYPIGRGLRGFKSFREHIQAEAYDYVIDAQGLLKSALIGTMARGLRAGFDKNSAREPLSRLFYQQAVAVDKKEHAITRTRRLFAHILNYPCPSTPPQFKLALGSLTHQADKPYCVVLHGTTWDSKHYPEAHWAQLVAMLSSVMAVKVPWGNSDEKQRAERLTANVPNAAVLPKLNLNEIAQVLSQAHSVIAVDTGLAHLAAALDVPTLCLFGPSAARLTGPLGLRQQNLQAHFVCSPCFKRHCVFQTIESLQPPCLATLLPAEVFKQWQILTK